MGKKENNKQIKGNNILFISFRHFISYTLIAYYGIIPHFWHQDSDQHKPRSMKLDVIIKKQSIITMDVWPLAILIDQWCFVLDKTLLMFNWRERTLMILYQILHNRLNRECFSWQPFKKINHHGNQFYEFIEFWFELITLLLTNCAIFLLSPFIEC